MNEKVLQDLYNRAKSKGYNKDINQFKELLKTNDNVLNDNYEYVKSKGYNKKQDDFKSLLFGSDNIVENKEVSKPIPTQVEQPTPEKKNQIQTEESASMPQTETSESPTPQIPIVTLSDEETQREQSLSERTKELLNRGRSLYQITEQDELIAKERVQEGILQERIDEEKSYLKSEEPSFFQQMLEKPISVINKALFGNDREIDVDSALDKTFKGTKKALFGGFMQQETEEAKFQLSKRGINPTDPEYDRILEETAMGLKEDSIKNKILEERQEEFIKSLDEEDKQLLTDYFKTEFDRVTKIDSDLEKKMSLNKQNFDSLYSEVKSYEDQITSKKQEYEELLSKIEKGDFDVSDQEVNMEAIANQENQIRESLIQLSQEGQEKYEELLKAEKLYEKSYNEYFDNLENVGDLEQELDMFNRAYDFWSIKKGTAQASGLSFGSAMTAFGGLVAQATDEIPRQIGLELMMIGSDDETKEVLRKEYDRNVEQYKKIAGDKGMQVVSDLSFKIANKLKEKEEKIRSGIAKPKEFTDTKTFFEVLDTGVMAIIETAPLLLATYLTGGGASASIAFGAQGAGDQYFNQMNLIEQGRKEYSPLNMLGATAGSYLAQQANFVGTKKLMETSQKLFIASGSAKKISFKGKLELMGKNTLVQSVAERIVASSEAMVSNVFDDDVKPLFDKGMNPTYGGMSMAILTGTGSIFGGYMSRAFSSQNQRKALDVAHKGLVDLNRRFADKNLSEKELQILREDFLDLSDKAKAITDNIADTTSKLNQEEFDFINEVDSKVSENKRKAIEIKNSENLTRKEKKRALERMKDETKGLLERKEQILTEAQQREGSLVEKVAKMEQSEQMKDAEQVQQTIKAEKETTEEVFEAKEKEVVDIEEQKRSVVTLPVSEIDQDPARFQYKSDVDPDSGVSEKLKGRKFKSELSSVISVWIDPTDGKTYVINGHHRLDLAKSTGQEAIDVKYVQAESAEEARTIGAMQNIAEGQGSDIDAAKIFRQGNLTTENLKDYGLSISDSKTRRGLALANLSDSLFDFVVSGKLDIAKGVIVGENIASKDIQEQFYNIIKGKNLTNATVEVMAQDIQSAPKRTEVVADLFGTTEKETADYEKRASLVASIRGVIGRAKNLLGKTAKGKEFLEEYGNKIDQAKSEGASTKAAEAMTIFDVLRNTSPEISAIINEAFEKLQQGQNKKTVTNEAARQIIEITPKILGRKDGADAKASPKFKTDKRSDAEQKIETTSVLQSAEELLSDKSESKIKTQEDKLKQAEENLKNKFNEWFDSKKNIGVIYDPKSQAKQDVELTKALVEYLKQLGIKGINEIKDAVSKLTEGRVKLNDDQANVLKGKLEPKKPKAKKPRQKPESPKNNEEAVENIKSLVEEYSKLTEAEGKDKVEFAKKAKRIIDNIKENLSPSQYKNISKRIADASKTFTPLQLSRLGEYVEKAILKSGEKSYERSLKDLVDFMSPKKLTELRQSGQRKGKLSNFERIALESARNAIKDRNIDNISDRFQELQEKAESGIAKEAELAELEGLGVAMNAILNGQKGVAEAKNDIKNLIKEGRAKLKEVTQKKAESRKEAVKNGIDAVLGGQKMPKAGTMQEKALNESNKGFFKRLFQTIDGFFDEQSSLRMLIDKIDRSNRKEGAFGKLDKLLYDKVAEARGKKDAILLEIEDKVMDAQVKIYGSKKKASKAVNERNKQKEVGTFKKSDGTTENLILSENEAIQLYNMRKNQNNLPTFEAMGWTNEMHDAIENFISENGKKWGDWQVQEFYPFMHEKVNDVYKKMNYMDLGFQENYVPVKRSQKKGAMEEQVASSPNAFMQKMVSVGYGSLKERVSSKQPFRIDVSADSMLHEYITGMSHYISFAEAIKEINAVTGNAEFRDAVRIKNGSVTLNVLDNFVERLAGEGMRQVGGASIFAKFRGLHTTSKLAISPLITIKQLSSAPAYVADIGVRNLTIETFKALSNPAKTVKDINRIFKNNPYLRQRYKKGFDRDMMTAMRKNEQQFFSGKQTIKDMMMFNVKYGDKGAIMLGYGVYSHYLKNAPKSLTPAEKEAYAVNKFVEATKMSQQSSNTEDQSFYQSGNAFQKLFTMYKTSPIMYMNQERKAVRDMYRGIQNKNLLQVKDGARRFAVYHVLLPSLFQYISNGLPGILLDWDEEDTGDMKRAIGLGSLNGIFIAGDMGKWALELIAGKPYAQKEVSLTPAFSDVTKLIRTVSNEIKKMEKSEEYYFDSIMSSLGNIALEGGDLTGLPVQRVKKTAENIMVADDKWDKYTTEEKTAIILGFNLKQIDKKKRKSKLGTPSFIDSDKIMKRKEKFMTEQEKQKMRKEVQEMRAKFKR